MKELKRLKRILLESSEEEKRSKGLDIDDGILYSASKDMSGNISIPQDVSRIWEDAFKGCTNVTGVTFHPKSKLVKIGDRAFSGCSISYIVLPKGLKSLGDEAFSNCHLLGSVKFTGSMDSIWVETFLGCSNLSSIVFPKRLRSIEYKAFSACSSLRSVILPYTVKSLSHRVFDFCTSLETIYLPNGLVDIGYCVFDGCKSLKHVSVPNNEDVLHNLHANCVMDFSVIKVRSGDSEEEESDL